MADREIEAPAPHPLAPLFRKVAALMALVRARSSPRVRSVARVALPVLLSAATIHWARRGRAAGASAASAASAAARAVRGVHFSEFVQLVKSKAVRTAAVGAGGVIYATLAPDCAAAATASVVTTQVVSLPPALLELLLAHGVTVGVARPSGGARALQGLLIGAPIVYLGVISLVLWRMANDQLGGGAAGAGSELTPSGGGGGGGAAGPGAVSFDEIAGIPHAKAQVLEVVDCLRNPAKYAAAGARCPRGVLLVGPPGTGKTLLARAIAANSGAAFLACAGSDFVEVFVGRGAARVRRTFAKARAAAPCVVFIDELDALGRARAGGGAGGGGGGASDEHEHAVVALLAELDGFSPAAGVLAVGATNRFAVLDEALVRPGRFDRVIRLRLPDAAERGAILAVHMRKLRGCDASVSVDGLASRTGGLSGAELANLVNEAALLAVRHGRTAVAMADFTDALRVYRHSRAFGAGGDEDGGGAEGVDGGGGGGALPPAMIAAILHNLQAMAVASGQSAQRTALG